MGRFKQSEDVLKIIDFSRRHKWAKYLCVGAVGVHYIGDMISSVSMKAYLSAKTAVQAAVPVVRRVLSVSVAAAFGVMVLPFGAFAAETQPQDETLPEEAPSESRETLPEAIIDKNVFESASGFSGAFRSVDEDSLEYTVLDDSDFIEGEPDETGVLSAETVTSDDENAENTVNVFIAANDKSDEFYMENIDNDDRQISVNNSSSESYTAIAAAFESYGIDPMEMNIRAMDIDIYGNETEVAQKAVVTVKVPDNMENHLDDLRAVRLDGGKIEILDSVYEEDVEGNTLIVFETPHLSTFALVSYADEPEDLQSGAAASDMGGAVGMAENSFAARIVKGRGAVKKKKYRVVKKLRKCDLIF